MKPLDLDQGAPARLFYAFLGQYRDVELIKELSAYVCIEELQTAIAEGLLNGGPVVALDGAGAAASSSVPTIA